VEIFRLTELRALVAAAGRGSRSGLPYPKTLFPIQGKPILVRILDLLAPYDRAPTVVVSPEGSSAVRKALAEFGLSAHLVIQPSPKGMGDAVLHLSHSPVSDDAEHILLVWGDCPFIQPATVANLLTVHKAEANDLTFATQRAEKAYTVVVRDDTGRVTRVIETREAGVRPVPGERDIGLFVFRQAIILDTLREDLPGKRGASTGEHGFLYTIEHLVSRGLRVAALPIASELDVVSFNSIDDIRAFL
jgi:bifunctional UDP-N-acetylglucosamine pyrophosphorylase / glucosamine-1-phosphate N-acetyltransferase